MILFGERSRRHALQEFLAHHQHERNHQGLANVIPFPDERTGCQDGTIRKAQRLGGLLNFYHRAAGSPAVLADSPLRRVVEIGVACLGHSAPPACDLFRLGHSH